MKYLYYLFYIIIQCSWGICQSLLGFVLFLVNIKCSHSFYNGAINTKWGKVGGISLGLFIFTPNYDDDENNSKITVHEYGHTIQSLILGPFYLISGICSICWCNMKRYKELRIKKGLSYSSFWVEAWANKLGEKVLHKPSID